MTHFVQKNKTHFTCNVNTSRSVMKRNAVNFVIDNTVTMRIGRRHVTRFELAKGVVEELGNRFRTLNSYQSVTLLRAVPFDGRYVYVYGEAVVRAMVESPPNESIGFSSNMMDRVIPTPTSDLANSHTLFFTDGESFDMAMRKAFEASLRKRAWPECNWFTIIVCDNEHGGDWLRRFRRIPGVTVGFIDVHTPIPYESILGKRNFDLPPTSWWARFRRLFRS